MALVLLVIAVAVVVLTLTTYLYPGTGSSSQTATVETSILPDGEKVFVYPTANATSSTSVMQDEGFAIQVSSDAGSTGYDWNVSTSGGIEYVNYTVASTSTLAGGAQVRDYHFLALDAGAQTVTLRDMRLFKPYDVAATITIHVFVSQPGSASAGSGGAAANYQPALDTLPGGSARLAMLSYSFTVNSTSGTLFAVFKNYSNSTTDVSAVYFDGTAAAVSSDCQSVDAEGQCEMTLTFGGGAVPAQGSSHTLGVTIGTANQLSFPVTAGTTAEAACTFTSSC